MTESDLIRFALAGASNISAACVTNPIDVIKIRLQLDRELDGSGGKGVNTFQNRYYNGMMRGSVQIVRDEGVRGLYKGLFASILREGSYSTIRLGAYEPIKRLLGATDPAHTPLWKKLAAGAISGTIGSSIATPTDLVKVRMQSCKSKISEKRVYESTLGAFAEIYRSGGINALYRGIGPTVMRAAVLTSSQIPAYDHSKHLILNAGLMEEGPVLHCTASFIAGFIAASTTSPIDVVKTRYMKQKIRGELYSSSMDCVIKTLRAEGPLGFYKGFFPNWMRIGPHTIVTFFIFEKLRSLIGMRPV